MDLLVAFALFIGLMAVSFLTDITMIVPLLAGLLLFSLTAVRRGFTVKQIAGFAADSLKESLIVVRIMVLIGCLTGIWRLSGTAAYFVSFGVRLIPPQLFLLAAFLLASVMSYALGTSFGVTATAGVILMSIARAGNVNPVLTAGAVMSGVYVGDRGSPAASSGNLVSVLTHTDMRINVREMLKCSLVPFAVCCVLYFLLSFRSGTESVESGITELLNSEFRLEWVCILPAVCMIFMPFCGISVMWSMIASIVCAAVIALAVQKSGIADCLNVMISGYRARSAALDGMISGGGIRSMLEVCGILLISCSYGSIFRNTGLLNRINGKLSGISERMGRFPVMLLLGVASAAVFCNQTIGAIMQSNLSADLYGDSGEEKMKKMLDMENSVIPVAGLVPWCIASSVPLSMLNEGPGSLLFAFYLWLMPLWWLLRYRHYEYHSEERKN